MRSTVHKHRARRWRASRATSRSVVCEPSFRKVREDCYYIRPCSPSNDVVSSTCRCKRRIRVTYVSCVVTCTHGRVHGRSRVKPLTRGRQFTLAATLNRTRADFVSWITGRRSFLSETAGIWPRYFKTSNCRATVSLKRNEISRDLDGHCCVLLRKLRNISKVIDVVFDPLCVCKSARESVGTVVWMFVNLSIAVKKYFDIQGNGSIIRCFVCIFGLCSTRDKIQKVILIKWSIRSSYHCMIRVYCTYIYTVAYEENFYEHVTSVA